jgi:hypothetical protein
MDKAHSLGLIGPPGWPQAFRNVALTASQLQGIRTLCRGKPLKPPGVSVTDDVPTNLIDSELH